MKYRNRIPKPGTTISGFADNKKKKKKKINPEINKTLLLVKQQKWLSEFCVKMHRVASKN
jgi:hypothetical protein